MEIRELIKKKIDAIVKKEFKIQKLEYDILIPEREEFGDFSTNVAFILVKKLGKSPREVAESIVGGLKGVKEIEGCEVAGAGFINFFISPRAYESELDKILKEKAKYGSLSLGKNRKVQIEFISANPTGPLTLGNGRGGFSGDTLASVLKKNGYDAKREYYVNDAGNQIKVLARSIFIHLGFEEIVDKEEEYYKGEYIEYVARKLKKEKGLKWIKENFEKTGQMAVKTILEEFIKKDIKSLGIKYDRWFSEKSLFEDGLIEKMWKFLQSKKLVYEKEGAYWLKTSEYGDEQDRVIRTSHGDFTYLMSDVAYLYERLKMRKFDKVIMLLGADHHGYVGRIKAVEKILGFANKLEVIIFQLVHLTQNGVEVRMSKRKGTFITLKDAVDDLGIDVARYYFISRDYGSHINIDLGVAKAQSSQNPVYYIQYASARINSVLGKLKTPESKISKSKIQIPNKIQNPNDQNIKYEIGLIKRLSQYPELVKEVGESYQVSKIALYAHELATDFHKFYENCKTIGDEREKARIKIVKATKIVLDDCLGLMGIEAKKKM